MYSLALLVVCSLNFAYLIPWVNKKYWRSYTCSDLDLLRDDAGGPAVISTLLLVLSAISVTGWVFWGITDSPYHARGGHFIRSGDDLALLVIGLVAFSVGSFGHALYKFGQIQAIREERKRRMDPYEKARLFRIVAEESLKNLEGKRRKVTPD